MKFYSFIVALALTFLFTGCSKKEQGAHKVHFDRDMCERCKMVISDRNYVAQIVENNRAYNFDDIGCALLWLDKKPPEWQKRAKFYIADSKSGEFIDMAIAHWSSGHTTPMDYGIGASKDAKGEGEISFEDVKKRIHAIKEKRMQSSIRGSMQHE